MPILDMARKVCLTKHMEKQNKGMEKPPPSELALNEPRHGNRFHASTPVTMETKLSSDKIMSAACSETSDPVAAPTGLTIRTAF